MQPTPPQTRFKKKKKASGWLWVLMLLMSVCFEGLGRKFLPFVPAVAFYFLKDVVLVVGLIRFGIPKEVKKAARFLYGGFLPILGVAIAFTVLQSFNPEQRSLVLAVLGLRAYWLWLLTPLVMASALRDEEDARKSVQALAGIAIVVALFAAYQFRQPASSSVNTYALYEGKEMNDVDTVHSTGRVRVSSTFSYLSGFADFTVLVPMILLALALDQNTRRGRLLMLGAVGACAATIPMSGSRGAVLQAGLGLSCVAYAAGFLATRVGRRVVAGGAVAAVLAVMVSPEAARGISDRFTRNTGESSSRLWESTTIIPVVAMAVYHYPPMGNGTGGQQNAAGALGLMDPKYFAEGENHKILIEQGVLGLAILWTARFGISVALLKASRRLRRARRGGLAGLALGLSAMNLMLNLNFDHVAQALLFIGVGYVLHAFMRLPAPVGVRADAGRLARAGGWTPARLPVPFQATPAQPTRVVPAVLGDPPRS